MVYIEASYMSMKVTYVWSSNISAFTYRKGVSECVMCDVIKIHQKRGMIGEMGKEMDLDVCLWRHTWQFPHLQPNIHTFIWLHFLEYRFFQVQVCHADLLIRNLSNRTPHCWFWFIFFNQLALPLFLLRCGSFSPLLLTFP